MSALEVLAVVMRLVGLLCVVPGLFFAANGVRTVVSGRIDERKSSASALRLGLPLLVVGTLLAGPHRSRLAEQVDRIWARVRRPLQRGLAILLVAAALALLVDLALAIQDGRLPALGRLIG